ncbi:MAG: hypothetical protein M3290_04975 [Actinomycetota bacterium]|nr:hypothetical protein [Actinomycetota bacterium]
MIRKFSALLLASSLVLAACGGSSGSSSDDARSKLFDAVDNLTGSAQTITVSVDSTPESLQAIAKDDGSELSTETAQKILDSSFSLATNGASDPKDAQAQLVLNVAGSDDVEIRVVDQVVYVRADVHSLLSTFGQDPSQADAIAQQAAASGYSFVGSLIQGKWVALEGLAELMQSLGGASPASSSVGQVGQIEDKLLEAFKGTASVSDEGSDSVGDHLVASFPLRDLASKLVDALKSINPAAAQTAPDLSKVPDKDVKLDAWVKDGKLVQVEFNFLQINDLAENDSDKLPEGVTKFALKVGFAPFSGTVEAPSGAVEVNMQQLLQTIMGGLGGSSSGSGSGSYAGNGSLNSFCKQLKAEPPSVQKQFKDQCPNL